MDSNHQPEDEEEECSICLDSLPKLSSKFVRMTCCGKGLHKKCYEGIFASTMSDTQKNRCGMCRAEYPVIGSSEYIDQFRPWIEKGKAWAQCLLGDKYRDGDGVDQSYQRAKEMYELAASQGDGEAQYSLGLMYREGQGVEQSYERAAENYEAAAKQGRADAQSNLGVLYYQGQGVEQSNETAREWWVKATEQGQENAINMLQQLDKAEGRTTPSFIPKPFECASCYRPHDPSENKLRPCNGCHRVYYCGRACQTKHWKREYNGHKKNCNKKAK